MSVLDPRELQASPLADLHALAAELGLEGFRRLRKDQLIEQIVSAQGGELPSVDDEPAVPDVDVAPEPEAEEEEPSVEAEADAEEESAGEEESADDGTDEVFDDADAAGDEVEEREEDLRSGVLDVLPNGSGFIRAEPYRQSR